MGQWDWVEGRWDCGGHDGKGQIRERDGGCGLVVSRGWW
jgi:hypothetical protein